MKTKVCNRTQSKKKKNVLGLNQGDHAKVISMDIRNGWINHKITPTSPALGNFPYKTQRQPKAIYVFESVSIAKL